MLQSVSPTLLDVGDADHEVLKQLVDVTITENNKSETKKEVTAVFQFKENAWFTNTELTTTVELDSDMPKKSTSTKINWKDGKNLTVKTVTKSQKNKKTGAKREVKKEIKCKSFFGLFRDFTDKDQEESYQEEEEEQPSLYLLNDTLEQLLDIVPFSLEYYLGVIEQEDGDEDGFVDEDDDGEDEDKKKSSVKFNIEPAKTKSSISGVQSGDGKEECKKQ